MPSIVVDVRAPYTAAEETALLEAVHAALVEAFGILPERRNLILQQHAPHRFVGNPDCAQPDRLTNVSLYVLRGRSVQAKRRLYRGIVRNLQALGIPPACVLIKLHEMDAANVGVRGGQAACDVEIGYPVDI